jgi:predicted acyltransferase
MDEQTLKIKDRLVSIDALRGLAMFLILAIDIGGAPILRTFTRLWGEDFANAASEQFNYGFGEGLRLCFIAMPMFIFVVGLVIPFSMTNRLLQKDKKRTYFHIVKRALILFILGLIAGGHLLHLRFANMPVYNNVLEYISISYLVCAILVLNTTKLVQFILTVVLLLLYWAVFLFIPVPGWHGEIFSEQMNLAVYIDNIILGPFHVQGSCRVLATISFIANMLLGVLMGQIIFSNRDKKSKTKLLFIYGIIMLLAGLVWGQLYPIIRTLWTSSFVLLTCGISTLLLASFYLICDVWGYSRWAFFFIVFGVNSIAIYMMAHLFDFSLIGNIFVGGLGRFFSSNVQDFVQAVAAMIVMWLIMYLMYRKKTFIKI